jgi:TetR/AcrR family transcriptional regulator, fatty acid metabolism regulator protein
MSFFNLQGEPTVPYRTSEKMAARKDARRKNILEVATRLFGERGYHAATVPMIVAASASSTGSFYKYFRNKEDVFGAALEALGEQAMAVILAAHATDAGPVAQVRAALEGLFLFLASNPREARLLIVESSGLSPDLERIRRAILDRYSTHVRETLAARPDVFTCPDISVAARCVVGAVHECLCAWLETPDPARTPPVPVARAVAEFNIRALTGSPQQ